MGFNARKQQQQQRYLSSQGLPCFEFFPLICVCIYILLHALLQPYISLPAFLTVYITIR